MCCGFNLNAWTHICLLMITAAVCLIGSLPLSLPPSHTQAHFDRIHRMRYSDQTCRSTVSFCLPRIRPLTLLFLTCPLYVNPSSNLYSLFSSHLASPFFSLSPLSVPGRHSVHVHITKWQTQDSFRLLKAKARCVQIYLSLSQPFLQLIQYVFREPPWALLSKTTNNGTIHVKRRPRKKKKPSSGLQACFHLLHLSC